MTEVVTTFELELTACASPTVLTPPSPNSSYSYEIGDAKDIVLAGWTADNGYCSLTVPTPTISPADTYGIFSFSADNLTTTVESTDIASVGTYTITTSVDSCDYASSVSYDVIVTNPCLTATFQIDKNDNKFPPGAGAIALIYKIYTDVALDITVNTATDIVSSITGTDPCGAIVLEFWATDASGSSEYAYDNAIFSIVGTVLDPVFRVSTTDLLAVGLYYLRLKVYYQDYQVETETNRGFII